MEYCGPSGLFAYPTVQTSSGAIASIPWRVLSTTIDGDADSTLGLGTNAQVPAGPEDGGFDAPPAAVQVPWAVAEGVPAGRVPVGEPSLRPGGVVSLPLLPASAASGETATMTAKSTEPATANAAAIESLRHFTVFMGAASQASCGPSVLPLFRISPETRPSALDLRARWVAPAAPKFECAQPCRTSA